jgi:hypothetical protein
VKASTRPSPRDRLQIVIAGVLPRFEDKPASRERCFHRQMIGLTIAAGSLVLVHNLYGQAAPDSRWGIRLPMIALAGCGPTTSTSTRSPI